MALYHSKKRRHMINVILRLEENLLNAGGWLELLVSIYRPANEIQPFTLTLLQKEKTQIRQLV